MLNAVNIVGSGLLPVEVDLDSLARDFDSDHCNYDPEVHPGLYLRSSEEDPLVVLYRTGKYIITGAETPEQLEHTRNWLLSSLADLGLLTQPDDQFFEIRNIVYTADIGEKVNLNALAIGLGLELTEYEPEQFPGLVYRPENSDCVILVFASGKVVVTGTPDRSHAVEAFQNLVDRVGQVLPG